MDRGVVHSGAEDALRDGAHAQQGPSILHLLHTVGQERNTLPSQHTTISTTQLSCEFPRDAAHDLRTLLSLQYATQVITSNKLSTARSTLHPCMRPPANTVAVAASTDTLTHSLLHPRTPFCTSPLSEHVIAPTKPPSPTSSVVAFKICPPRTARIAAPSLTLMRLAARRPSTNEAAAGADALGARGNSKSAPRRAHTRSNSGCGSVAASAPSPSPAY